jgi:hypothetical protein
MLIVATTVIATAAEQRVIKVLPHLMDKEGRIAKSPSLFERDAYQQWLRENPDQQSGVRYDILWQSYISGEYTLKLELLGRVENGRANARTVELKLDVKDRLRHWNHIKFEGEEFHGFGQIVAWRVSIWQDGEILAKEQSFLWE